MRHIVAIDQSTSASKAFLVDEGGFIVERGALEHKQHYPAPGRVEHDASEIWHNVQTLIDNLIDKAGAKNVAAIAISNQRETTVLWDAASGEPVCPAIVWQDVRGEAACRELAAHAERVHEITGLYLSPYFPAGKVRSLFAERQDLKARAEKGELRLGTIDSYLVYRLTGGKHLTDATNASRTQLMELRSLTWSAELLDLFGIPASLMPEAILGADGDFGSYRGIPITGVLGDSHAALFGQGCHRPGMAKATYGTGSSVMMNVGDAPVISRHGLSASVAFRVGGRTDYALEGNVTCSGDTLVWLCHDVSRSRRWRARWMTAAARASSRPSPGWARPTLIRTRAPSSAAWTAASPGRTSRARRWNPSPSKTRTCSRSCARRAATPPTRC